MPAYVCVCAHPRITNLVLLYVLLNSVELPSLIILSRNKQIIKLITKISLCLTTLYPHIPFDYLLTLTGTFLIYKVNTVEIKQA